MDKLISQKPLINSNKLGTLLIICSGVLAAMSFQYFLFWLGWISLIPLIIALDKQSPKQAFRSGLLFGLVISLFIFSWMISSSGKFTGSGVLYGIAGIMISTMLFSLFYAVAFFIYTIWKVKQLSKFSLFKNTLLFSLLWMLSETLRTLIFGGFPWYAFHVGYSLADSTLGIQPVEYFGYDIMTLIVVLVNYLAAYFLQNKFWTKLYIPITVVVAYMLTGFIIYQSFGAKVDKMNTFTMALASNNMSSETNWNKTTGDSLAHIMIKLNQKAVAMKPDFIVWSESAIPWNYSPDDPLLNEFIKLSSPNNITELIGMNVEVEGKKESIYNAAIMINPDGTGTTYLKQRLLTFIEEPLGGKSSNISLPFMAAPDVKIMPGENQKALPTNKGIAGMMICNESVYPAYRLTKEKVNFLVNISNDRWFNKTYIVGQHYYNCRIRAVETRKDIAINSNSGYCGAINAAGDIIMKSRDLLPAVNRVSIHPNSFKTLASSFPYWLDYVGLLLVLLIKIKQ